MRYCSKCGAMNDTEANFCQGCGAKFTFSSSEEIKTDYTTPFNQGDTPKQEQFAYQNPAPQNNVAYYPQSVSNPEHEAAKSRAIAALILGICSIVFSSVFFIGLPCGIIGIILAVKALKEIDNGMAKAGKICSIIGLVFTVLTLILIIFCVCLAIEIGVSDSYYGNDYWDVYDGIMDQYGGSYGYDYDYSDIFSNLY